MMDLELPPSGLQSQQVLPGVAGRPRCRMPGQGRGLGRPGRPGRDSWLQDCSRCVCAESGREGTDREGRGVRTHIVPATLEGDWFGETLGCRRPLGSAERVPLRPDPLPSHGDGTRGTGRPPESVWLQRRLARRGGRWRSEPARTGPSGAVRLPRLGAGKNVPSHGAALGGAEVSSGLEPGAPPGRLPWTPGAQELRGRGWRRGAPTPRRRPCTLVCKVINRAVHRLTLWQSRAASPAPLGEEEVTKCPGHPPAWTCGGSGSRPALCPGEQLVLGTRAWALATRQEVREGASGCAAAGAPAAGAPAAGSGRGSSRRLAPRGGLGCHGGPQLALSCSVACKPRAPGPRDKLELLILLRNCYFPPGGFVFGISVSELQFRNV